MSTGKNEKGSPLNYRTRLLFLEILDYHIFEISTDARVVSQSKRSVQPCADLSNAIVKFSTAEGNVDVFMSTRAKSESAPG